MTLAKLKNSNAVTISVQKFDSGIEYVSETNEEYSGYVDFARNGETLEISHVSAEPKQQGLGTVLMHYAANYALECRLLNMKTLMTAPPAIPFYKSIGFRIDPNLALANFDEYRALQSNTDHLRQDRSDRARREHYLLTRYIQYFAASSSVLETTYNKLKTKWAHT
ncbi:MAG: GNAT family N-acetyltransferase [Pseudomonadota bacterium]